jgi:DNA repair protein REV1
MNSAIESNPHPSHFGTRPDVDMGSEWVKRNSSTAPDFLSRYFKSSRLHHISTWKNDLKEFVMDHLLQKEQPKEVLKQSIIMHVDMDCFFASIGSRDNPELKGTPIAIAHSIGSSGKSTSEIASCNYEARKYGISNGMTIGKARTLCSNLSVLNYDFDKYDQASRQLYLVLLKYADDIQAVSCDEAFVEVSTAVYKIHQQDLDIFDQEMLTKASIKLADQIRAEIREATQCNASIGISHNILLSRLSTKKAKPDGIYYLSMEHVDEFMNTINIRDLPGIGRQISSKLKDSFGIETCKELQYQSKSSLESVVGEKTGKMLYEYARGIDNKQLENKERQSIGAEVNWGVRFDTKIELDKFLMGLSQEVSSRLTKAKAQGKLLTLKIKKRKSSKQAYKVLGCGDCGIVSSLSFDSR